MQVEIKNNVYCQQCGEEVDLVYVNQILATVYVDKDLSKRELLSLGKSLYKIINRFPSMKNKAIASYKDFPSRDGELYVVM